MKKTFVALHKFADVVQTVAVWIAFFCIFVWFYRFFDLPYDFDNPFMAIIEIVPNIVRNAIPYTVDFAGRSIDVSYFPAAVILFIIHIIIKAMILEALERSIQKCIQQEYAEREKEEEIVNKEIEQELKNNTLTYRYFVGLLSLHLEYTTGESFNTNKKAIELVKEENNKKILYDIYQKYRIKCNMKDDKIIIMSDDYDKFDGLLLDIIDDVKHLYRINKVNGIQTSFTLSYDAITNPGLSNKSINTLEKISTFRYYNKIIVTTLFASRYGYCDRPKFELGTMGISRFFQKMVDKDGEVSYASEDFDLYSLKLKD